MFRSPEPLVTWQCPNGIFFPFLYVVTLAFGATYLPPVTPPPAKKKEKVSKTNKNFDKFDSNHNYFNYKD